MIDLNDKKQGMQDSFIPSRVEAVNPEYLAFELKHLDIDYFRAIAKAWKSGKKLANKSNSAILYCLGLSDTYDARQRCLHHVDGSGPDIDTDFSPDGRDRLIEALQKKYGVDHVARICTYTPWNLKTSVVDFAKVTKKNEGPLPFNGKGKPLQDEEGNPIYGHYSEGEEIANKIPDSFRGRHTKWEDLKDDADMQRLIANYQTIFNCAGPIDGQPKNDSIHACGVLISPEPLSHQIPLRTVKTDSKGNDISWYYITQWEGPQLEAIGFTKYDLLVIDNLKIAQDTCRSIGKTYEWVSDEVPLDDQKAFDLINNGFVGGLFQIEEGHVLDVIQKTNPQTVDDIAAISAVIRPGPRDSGLLDDYVKFRQSGQLQNRLHPLLDKVLYETGGVMIYQEQVIKAFQILSGMDLATADEVRRAMGKKKIELMKQYQDLFVEGCKHTHKLDTDTAQRIWKTIAAFADYGFNKSHARAYALITYQTAYLKAHYPVEFMANLLSARVEKPDKLQKYIREARLMGLNVSPPTVNYSGLGFTKIDNKTIGFGLNAIQGIGETQTAKILEAREAGTFTSIEDFFSRIDRSKVNSKVTDILAKCGAFDIFGFDREKLVDRLPDIAEYYKARDEWQESLINVEERDAEIAQWEIAFAEWSALKKDGLVTKLDTPITDPVSGQLTHWDPPRPKKPVKKNVKVEPAKFDLSDIKSDRKQVTQQMVNWEAQYCKFFISAHPLDFITIPGNLQYNLIEDIDEAHAMTGKLLVAISNIEEKKIKSGRNKGKTMAYVTIQDHSGYAELTIFATHYTNLAGSIKVGDVLYLPYKLDGELGSMPKLLPAGPIKCV